uniref:HECT-type E3 ubiquitin transferase n=1 Tax=Chrysotila carterae TaxID=13221 RepID=A0A7S4BN04_CHRCT
MPGANKVVSSPRVVPRLSGNANAVQIAVGGGHVLVRLRDGSVVAWGRGSSGELGGGTAAAATPKQVELPADAVDIAAGREHSLALLSDGRVVGWGSARCGQLGLGDTVDKTIPTELALTPDVRGSVKFVCAGGHSSALLLDEAAGSVAARAVDVISLDLVRNLCDSEDFSRLAQLVGAVFGSPALFNASFAPAGKLQSQDLEAVYVLLLQSYEKSPAVLNALRSSMRQLLDVLALVASANPECLLPFPNQGGSSPADAGSSLEPPPAARSLSGALFTSARNSSAAASNEPFVLKPIIGLLCNPLLGHAAEAAHLYRAAAIVDNLPSEHRARFTKMLQELPADILVARCVRPMREALERVFKLLFAGGSSDHVAAIQVVRLLGTLRDANEDNRKQGGGVSPSEFYSPFLSERLGIEELRRDYFIWAAHGPSERGTTPQANFSFCSEPWLFSPLAKSKLLQIEASHRMGRSQQHAMQAMLGVVVPAEQQLLFPPTRKRSSSREVACDAGKAAKSPFFVLTVRRDHLVDDTLDALACSVIGNLLKPLRVVFEGEPAIDEGGVRKEFFQLLCEALFDANFGMFAWNAEARTFWFSTASYEAEAEFFLVGLVIGLAIHNGVILDLHFPPLLYRRLMNEPVVFDDLREVQPDLHRGLCALRQFEGDVESTFMADHTIVTNSFGHSVVHELVPDGANVPVTNENREEYLRLYVDYLLVSGVRVQFDAFQRGFLKLCDGPAFSFLTALELEELTCGTPVLDFKALQSATKYDGYTPESQVVQWFWEVVFAFELEEKKALLFFATGCDRAPVGGLGKLKFVIQRAGDDSMNLPHAHTCFNLLSIPEYGSRGKLRDRLTIAIHNSQGFGLQ